MSIRGWQIANLMVENSLVERSALYQLADRALNGQLRSLLERWAEDRINRRHAARLLTERLGGIAISPDTLDRWMTQAAADREQAPKANGDESTAA